jgi:hypothetical protein
MEKYMCSRFFIDFSDLNQQRQKLESYLNNHFSGEENLKHEYLFQQTTTSYSLWIPGGY